MRIQVFVEEVGIFSLFFMSALHGHMFHLGKTGSDKTKNYLGFFFFPFSSKEAPNLTHIFS